MGPTALLPLRRKACWGFFRPKNPTASAGCEPANLGTKGQHATSRPSKPLRTEINITASLLWHFFFRNLSQICYRVSKKHFTIFPTFNFSAHKSLKFCPFFIRFYKILQIATLSLNGLVPTPNTSQCQVNSRDTKANCKIKLILLLNRKYTWVCFSDPLDWSWSFWIR